MSNLRRDEVVTLAATALLTGLLIFTAGREQEDERPPGSDSDSLDAFRARVPADEPIALQKTRAAQPGRARAGRTSGITDDHLLTLAGGVAFYRSVLALQDDTAKNKGGRRIPLHPDLRAALIALRRPSEAVGPVIASQRAPKMSPVSIVNWFAQAFRVVGLEGARSLRGAARSTGELPEPSNKPAHRCVTFNSWPGTGQIRQLNGTSMVTRTPRANSCL
jgi:hypothetical protein